LESLPARGPGQATGPGEVDYRLVRKHTLDEFRRGRLSKLDVCDAHPELLRNAEHCGRPSTEACPICESAEQLVLVTYVFGDRLPPSGRCILSERELAKLDRGRADLAGYVVEVCRTCNWNHLIRSFPVGGRPVR
jgi:hypothetical protein